MKLFISVVLVLFSSVNFAAGDEADKESHNRLVLLALDYDFYNETCRGMTIDKYFNQVKRLFVTKYSLTPNNYIEAFISGGQDFREFKADYKKEFIKKLAEEKGCKGAKSHGWLERLKKDYKKSLREVEDSNWYPVINRLELSENNPNALRVQP